MTDGRTRLVFGSAFRGQQDPRGASPGDGRAAGGHAAEHLAGLYTRLDIRCRGSLCYVDVFTEPKEPSPSLLQLIGETLATVSLVAFKGQTVCLLVEAADGVTANLVEAAIDDVHVSRD